MEPGVYSGGSDWWGVDSKIRKYEVHSVFVHFVCYFMHYIKELQNRSAD
jgi:hypothetical protein